MVFVVSRIFHKKRTNYFRAWQQLTTRICYRIFHIYQKKKEDTNEVCIILSVVVVVVQSLSRVWLFAIPWTAACQASLSFTNSRSLLKLMSIESVMPSNHLVLCRPLLLLPSVFPSIRVFSNQVLHVRWPKYCNYSLSINSCNEYYIIINIL